MANKNTMRRQAKRAKEIGQRRMAEREAEKKAKELLAQLAAKNQAI
jgi:hypothetical protein